jgi:DNA polymerase III subunit delta'
VFVEKDADGLEEIRRRGFPGIIGQDAAVGFLKKVVSATRIPHAYVFTGIKGIGKATAAFAFARALNCLDPVDGDGCGLCLSCRQMAGGNFPDLEVVRPDGRVLKIEQVRELIRRIGYKTVSGRYRVVLMEDAGALSREAANAFLKTLEEPPPGNIIILNVLDKNDLLPTILSRCQRVPFRPVPVAALGAWLRENHGIPARTADVIARLSEGSVGRALRFAAGGDLVERRRHHLEAVMQLGSRAPDEVVWEASLQAREEKNRVERAGEEDAGLQEVLGLWKTFFRDMLVLKSHGPEDLLILGDEDGALKKRAEGYKMEGLLESLLILERAQRDLSRSRNMELVMETTMLALRRAAGN